jgi:hypothetical protein
MPPTNRTTPRKETSPMIVSSFSQFGEDEEFEPVNVGLPPMSAKRV